MCFVFFDDTLASASTSSLFCTACDKLFAKQSVYDAHLPGKKHLKAVERLKTAGTAEAAVSSGPTGAALLRDIAEAEATVVELMKRFDARRQATLVNVERKQARTAEELEEEAEEVSVSVFLVCECVLIAYLSCIGNGH